MNIKIHRSGHVGACSVDGCPEFSPSRAGEEGAMKLGAVNPVYYRGAPPRGPVADLARTDRVLWTSLARTVEAIGHAWARRRGREPPLRTGGGV